MISFAKRERAQRAAACVGIDAGKFQHALVVRPHGQPDSKPLVFKTTRAGFDEAIAYVRAQAPAATPDQILVGIEFAGCYGFTFAHYLAQQGFQVVSVLPASTKQWKHVVHGQPLKTDPKDALVIADLLAQGQFVTFPFLQPRYADLRYLAAARERLSLRRRGVISQIRTLLQVVFPEFEEVFPHLLMKTPFVLLRAYPGPQDLLAAPRRVVLRLLKTSSHGQLGKARYEQLVAAAKATIGLPGAQARLRPEIARALDRLRLYEEQITAVEAEMVEALQHVPETPCLLSIPMMGPVTAAVFLGSIGDPQAYEADEQILRVAGLSLVERSSGVLKGTQHISKRGRPLLRLAAYMFAVRSISRPDGLLRAEYDGLLARNGGKTRKALVAIMRSALRLFFSVARDRRTFTAEPPPPRHARRALARSVA
jgi:transposase